MDYYKFFNHKFSELIEAGVIWRGCKLVLYPFGQHGMLVKQILNWRYGIKETFICDEEINRINPDIKSLDFLLQIDVNDYLFIITSDNLLCWDEIRKNLRRYVGGAEKNIIDLFSHKPLKYTNPRIASLEMASREIYEKNIAGAVAEAGVYKGLFAKYINYFFYDRKMYLFDTFEGFVSNDVEIERNHGYSLKKTGYYSGTSVEEVLRNMPFKKNILIEKGYFPDTTKGIDEQFCFVSLDMDLYQPIKAGLEYFYPRLVRGGYLFVHDCNIGHDEYKGARIALLEYVERKEIGYVMLPDNKTAVLTKG